MRFSPLTQRLAGLGGAKWEIHAQARALQAAGHPVILLTIGEPDCPPPPELGAALIEALHRGRIAYSNGQGEMPLLRVLAERYSRSAGRPIGTEQIMAFPGTQTALYVALHSLVGPGDEVLVADPLYATYEGLIAATGARIVPVPLRAENGFRLAAADVAARVTAQSRLLFLNSPHNPTGAILTPADLTGLADLAVRHDLWILSDEVYEELVFPGQSFATALSLAGAAERVVVTSSISKSHAAPGYRSGWCIGPKAFCAAALPVSETMLFGNQPFIADATAHVLSRPSEVAQAMALRFHRRAELMHRRLHGVAGLALHRPQAGMFALLDIRATGQSGTEFATGLLRAQGVAAMPGESFGVGLRGWLRLSLTQPDEQINLACDRIVAHAQTIGGRGCAQ